MKKVILSVAASITVLGLVGCSSTVEYDYLNDSFRYKPESNWSYISKLGPENTPEVQKQNPEQK